MDNLAHIYFAGVEPAPRKPGVVAAATGGPAVDDPLHPFLEWIMERAGLNPAVYRPIALHRRIPACLRRLRAPTPDSAKALLERTPELLPVALSTALIGVSGFFRDRPVFDAVEAVVLPELLQVRAGLRVCSVGASDGREIYSLAIQLAEAGMLDQSTLLGIDCRADAIRVAKAGIYHEDDMAGVGADRRRRFFHPVTGGWRVSPLLRDGIRWRVQDLWALDETEAYDLILFRNVAIYFNETHGAEAWARLFRQLAPGGFLVTGKAERPPASLPFTRVGPSIYRKSRAT